MSGALALGLIGAGLAWVVAGRLMRPIRVLADEAARVRAGGDATALPWVRPSEEVSAVHEAISRLADTARLQAQATATSQQLFSALSDSLPQIVFQVDAAGRIDHVNQQWLSQVKPDAPFAMTDLQGLVAADDRSRFDQAWATASRSGTDLHLRCRVRLRSGEEPIWMDVQARVVERKAGTTARWVATLLDVHEIVTRAEDSLIALEHERSARLEAERSAKLRDEFLATVSHELRSPLSAITGWSEILRRRNKTNEPVLKAADIIARNAQVQARLIDDLLDITAVMAGKLVLDIGPVDVVVVAGEVIAARQQAAHAKQIRLVFTAHPPLTVDGDRQRIAQVLDNLVGNAVKFTDTGGTVQVVASSESGFAVLRVRDTGRGIEPSFVPHVFERMRQEDSSKTRKAGGLGLGLAIVHGLVTLHEGWVKVESAGLGHGSMFTVALPLGKALQASPASSDAPVDTGDSAEVPDNLLRGLRVLLVDDEADAREVAHVALASLGAEVRAAASGAEVLRVLQESRFDVLVSDIGMPDMDGLTLIRAVRQLPNGSAAALPAIALTAFAMESDRRLGIEAGFQAYVTKPLSIRRLSEAVLAAIRAGQVA
jgi:signal transduction histidine kinase/ActR/RegA family two-component response regulator